MDIARVNGVLEKAIVFLQEGEAEGLYEAAFAVPTPADMHKKHGMRLPGADDALIEKGQAREGMMFGSMRVVKASAGSVTLIYVSQADLGSRFRGKTYTYKWDGIGYGRTGNYLHKDGAHKLPGSKPLKLGVVYPEGTVIQSREKWVWVVSGKGKVRDGEVSLPVRKLSGKKAGTMTISKSGWSDSPDVYVYGISKSSVGLTNVTVRPPYK